MYYCEEDRWYCRSPSCDGQAMFSIDEVIEDMKKDIGGQAMTREKKWTKGDWEILDAYRSMFLIGVKHGWEEIEICDIASDIDDDGLVQPTEEQIANARLIRAAPKLVDALEEFRAWVREQAWRRSGSRLSNVTKKVDEALAQAYGEKTE